MIYNKESLDNYCTENEIKYEKTNNEIKRESVIKGFCVNLECN